MTFVGTLYTVYFMRKIRILLLVSALISIHACQKKGCIDRLARNYDSSAKKETACYYDGRIVFWVDNATAASFNGQVLEYYLNDKLVKTDSVLQGYFQDPECDEPKAHTFTQDLGSDTELPVRYRV